MQGVLTENLVFTNWDLEVDGELKNNGHTIKFTPFPGSPAITTRTHLGEYQLAQFHMHWGENDGAGSEHRINGHQAALEIHFVHERVAPSGPDSEKYLVVGVLAYAGSNSPQSPLINRLPISVMPETGYLRPHGLVSPRRPLVLLLRRVAHDSNMRRVGPMVRDEGSNHSSARCSRVLEEGANSDWIGADIQLQGRPTAPLS